MDPLEAAALQESLRSRVRRAPLAYPPSLVAGVDVAYASSDSPTVVAAAVVVLSFPALEPVASRERGPNEGQLAKGQEPWNVRKGALATVKPVYVSVGHLIDLPLAVDLTLRLAPRHRLPETTRLADQLSRSALRKSAK